MTTSLTAPSPSALRARAGALSLTTSSRRSRSRHGARPGHLPLRGGTVALPARSADATMCSAGGRRLDDAHDVTEALLAKVTDDSPLDDAEVDTVVRLNLSLADGIAARYVGRGIEREDLVQVARLGLVKAVRRFRPGLGQSFAGFAAPTISGEIKRHFRDTGWVVRPPRRLQELGARLRDAEKELEQELRRQPTAGELSRALGVSTAAVRAAREAAASFHAMSLDVPATTGYAQSSGALDDVDDPFAAVEDSAWLGAALAALTAREQEVLRLRFVESLTQAEIATHIGVSQMQVSRILRATLSRLRTRLLSSMESAA